MNTTRHQRDIEIVSFIVFAAFIGMFFVWREYQKTQQQLHINVPVITNNNIQAAVIPTTSPTSTVENASQISSDGTKKLHIKTSYNTNGTQTYVFSTIDISTNHETSLYTTTASESERMSIPFNTWSPDNKYLFILKNDTDAMVFNASGEPFANDEAFLSITDLFKNKSTGNTIREVTGWGANSLIIVNTLKPNNEIGPSYWFEVPSKAVIQLSTLFE